MERATVTITRTPDGGCWVNGQRVADALDQATTWVRREYPLCRVFLVESGSVATDPTEPPLVLDASPAYVVCACLACAALLLVAVWIAS